MNTKSPAVVFTGDSITDTGKDRAGDSLGTGYVAKLAEGPLTFARVVSAGVSGDRVADLEVRFEGGTLTESPNLVSIFIDINDTWQTVTGETASPFGDFEAAYQHLIKSLDETSSVLIVPFVAPIASDQEGWFSDLRPRQDLVHHPAAEYDCAVVDLGLMTREYSSEYKNKEMAESGVHPIDPGHKLIAEVQEREARTRFEALHRQRRDPFPGSCRVWVTN